MMHRRPSARSQTVARCFAAGLLALTSAAAIAQTDDAGSAEDILANRPAFSRAEVPPRAVARCEELRTMAEALPPTGFRVDLHAAGKLTLVKSDGALWYLVICSDLRVMCVTYESNDMKVGDLVTVRGAYRRLDRNHAVLDPCLASRGAPEH